MLDIDLIRKDPKKVIDLLATRQADFSHKIWEAHELDKKIRTLLDQQGKLNAEKNVFSEQFSSLIKIKKNAEAITLQNKVKILKEEIQSVTNELNLNENKLQSILLEIPNLPSHHVPIGKSENDNKVIHLKGKVKIKNKNFLDHWTWFEKNDYASFEKAVLISGTRQVIYKNEGAKLQRALKNFMLDHHFEAGYSEILPPDFVNAGALFGTGQLPKFKEDLFKLQDMEMYLSPTAEVQLTNLYANEIIEASKMPIKMCGYSHCFRAEAGSAGRDVKGIIRLHQFRKIEMVNICIPEDSYDLLENLTQNAEHILEKLEIPFRRIALCTADMGFGSALTYDLEVWMPSYNAYKEISSCTNFESFQSRRAKIRYKLDKNDKSKFVHTLNGSGLAIDRCLAALIENHQNEDGTISIPKALQKYLNNRAKI